MNLESLGLNFLFPRLVVNLDVVQNGINEHPDVGILVAEQFKYDRHHLSLVQHDFPRGCEEQEFEKRIKDLLHYLVILLLRAE